MQVFEKTSSRNELWLLNDIPYEIRYKHNSPAVMHFSENFVADSCCIKCYNPKCLNFSAQEVAFETLHDLTHDTSTAVCPSEALQWDEKLEQPYILSDKCIHCGLCIRRCPVGAIYYNQSEKKVKIATARNVNVSTSFVSENSILEQENVISSLNVTTKFGSIIMESDAVMKQIYNKISILSSNNAYNLFIRNIFLSLNCKCAISRVGDVYTRMDAVYSTNNYNSFGAIEVEFGKDTLDAVRGVLDDIAVLNARYGVPKEKNDAVVACLQLPNIRQGYWQVIKDVFSVEKLAISTITVGALLILVWNCKNFDLKENSYYADFGNMSIREALTNHIGRKVNLSDRFLGILEPQK